MRRTRVFVALLAVVCCASAARAASLHGYVFLMPVDSQFRSVGFAEYLNDLNQLASAVLSGEHSVSRPGAVDVFAVQGDGLYDHILEGPASPGACYDTSLHVIADPPGLFNTKEGTWTGDRKCAPPPSPPPPPPPQACSQDLDPTNCDTPLVVNLGHGAYELSGPDDPVIFDLDADGTPDRITWTAAGAPMGFLALDRNGNGIVDNGSELFGNHTPLASGHSALNGFEALKQYDANGDGVIDAADPVWTNLLVWTDANHNGLTDSGELTSIAVSNVAALGLDYHFTGRHDQYGNQFRYAAKLVLGDKKDDGSKKYYDIYFVRLP